MNGGHRQAVSDSRAKFAPTEYVSNMDEWPKVMHAVSMATLYLTRSGTRIQRG